MFTWVLKSPVEKTCMTQLQIADFVGAGAP